MTRGARLVALAALAALLGSCRGERDADTVRFWAFGREGEVVRELVPEFERRHPGPAPRGAAGAVDGGAREAAHRLRRQRHAGCGAARQHLDPGVRRARRAGAARSAAPRIDRRARRFLPRHLGHQRGRRRDLGRALVRRHPRALLPHRPGGAGRRRRGRRAPGAEWRAAMERICATPIPAGASPSCCRSTSGSSRSSSACRPARLCSRDGGRRGGFPRSALPPRHDVLPRALRRSAWRRALDQHRRGEPLPAVRRGLLRDGHHRAVEPRRVPRRLPAGDAGALGHGAAAGAGRRGRTSGPVAGRRLEPGALPPGGRKRSRLAIGRIPVRAGAAGALLRAVGRPAGAARRLDAHRPRPTIRAPRVSRSAQAPSARRPRCRVGADRHAHGASPPSR